MSQIDYSSLDDTKSGSRTFFDAIESVKEQIQDYKL